MSSDSGSAPAAVIDTLRLAPDGETVTRATQWLEALAGRENWPPALAFGLSLSLDEALTNVVSYAFADGTFDGLAPGVTLSLCRAGDEVRLEIVDNGTPYDPTAATLPPLAADLDAARPGGHGLRLMRHYMKALAWRHEDGCNHLTLIAEWR